MPVMPSCIASHFLSRSFVRHNFFGINEGDSKNPRSGNAENDRGGRGAAQRQHSTEEVFRRKHRRGGTLLLREEQTSCCFTRCPNVRCSAAAATRFQPVWGQRLPCFRLARRFPAGVGDAGGRRAARPAPPPLSSSVCRWVYTS